MKGIGLALLCTQLWVVACRAPDEKPLMPDLRNVAGTLVLDVSSAAEAEALFGLSATPAEGVFLQAEDDAPSTRVFLYERRGEEEAYGVYGLQAAKNAIEVPWPFDPDSVVWDGVGPREALERLLIILGTPDPEAVLEAESRLLWSEGARVVFLMEVDGGAPNPVAPGPFFLIQPLR